MLGPGSGLAGEARRVGAVVEGVLGVRERVGRGVEGVCVKMERVRVVQG